MGKPTAYSRDPAANRVCHRVLDCVTEPYWRNLYWHNMEKRLPIAMLVNLAPAQVDGSNGTELTYTNNVSAHGACVVSDHPWQPGEIAQVTSFLDHIAMRGKVVYCRKHGDDQFAIGLSFQNSAVVWSIYLKYTVPAQETIPMRQRRLQ